MGVNSLPKTVTRQCRDCYLNPGRSAPASSTLTTRLPSYHRHRIDKYLDTLLANKKQLKAMPQDGGLAVDV